ncbi:MAG: glycosyltransferase family 2 protein [Candidatus Binataceae bacterium]
MPFDVTVIVPAYNRRVMAVEAIASVLAQRGASFELIAVDDGSTDGTCHEFERIATMVNRESAAPTMRTLRIGNRGPAAARNAGAELATAPFIAFLDSDDLWLPHKLQRQLAYMHAHPQYAISQTRETWLRDGRRVNPGARHRQRAGDIFMESLRTCLISPSAAMMRTQLFRSLGGFDEAMAAAEDYDLWLRILLTHQAGLLDEALATRRAGHPGQLSAAVPALDRFRILALAKLLANANLSDQRRRGVCDVLAEKCLIYARGLARRGHEPESNFFLSIAERARISWAVGADQALDHAVDAIRTTVQHAEGGTLTPPIAAAGQ